MIYRMLHSRSRQRLDFQQRGLNGLVVKIVMKLHVQTFHVFKRRNDLIL